MNTSDEKNSAVEPEEERFVQRALAKVEKAERFSRIKEIVVTVIMVIGLILAVCTSKLVGLINKNTTAILRAIAAIEAQVRIHSGRQAMAQTTERTDKEN